ncbi:hypothetical protein Ciccas_009073 [Cichlidogyrus casuarinus]|uniref:Uncharacterized protein n=1 Tax=Cichlidogyrus casuarinus TaxID=1844966 RepID=A0ABD2Q2H2_9PLAT
MVRFSSYILSQATGNASSEAQSLAHICAVSSIACFRISRLLCLLTALLVRDAPLYSNLNVYATTVIVAKVDKCFINFFTWFQHQHEFVHYPNLITMSVKEFGIRVLRGLAKNTTLLPLSKPIPDILVSKNCPESDSADFKKQIEPIYLIVPELLYNRISTAERLSNSGYDSPPCPNLSWNVSLPGPALQSIARTNQPPSWYEWTGLCSSSEPELCQVKKEEPCDESEFSSSLKVPKLDPNEDFKPNRTHRFKITMSAITMNKKPQEFFLGSSLQYVHRSVACYWPLSPKTRFVFVRRQSTDCGFLIAPTFKSLKFTREYFYPSTRQ